LPQSNMGDWYSINGDLQVTEMHSIVYDPITQLITAGTQDNGTIQQENPNSMTWSEILSGDGGKVCIDTLVIPGLSVLYFSAQYLLEFQRKTYNSSKNIINQHTVTLTNPNFKPQMYTPIQTNSVVGGRLLLAGEGSVYESLDKGDTLTDIGITGTGNCSCIAYGGMKNGIPNPNVVYACKSNKVYLRTSPNQTLTLTAGILPTNRAITDIAVDPTDWARAFIVSNSEGLGKVYMTTNAGETWINITGTLATSEIGEIPCSEIIRDPIGGFGGLVVGTEYGVWLLWKNIINNITSSTTSTSIAWVKVGTQIPNVQINDINYNAADDILVIGTCGRGAWSIENIYSWFTANPPRITSMMLRVTEGINTYDEHITLSSSTTSLGTKKNKISNQTLINAISNSESGTTFYPEIITTYDTGTSVIRTYGPPFVTP
jgi:hypothetical protein